MRIWSSLLFSFLHPMMLTLFKLPLLLTRSRSPTAVIFVPPRSSSSINLNWAEMCFRPSSSTFVQPRRLSFLKYFSSFSLTIPESDRFLHSASERTWRPLSPPLEICLNTLFSVGLINSCGVGASSLMSGSWLAVF